MKTKPVRSRSWAAPLRSDAAGAGSARPCRGGRSRRDGVRPEGRLPRELEEGTVCFLVRRWWSSVRAGVVGALSTCVPARPV